MGHIDLEDKEDEELFSNYGAVPLEMEPGDVLFHSLSTPHGSRANLSDSTRRIFYIHYLAEEVYEDGYSRESWASEKPGWTPKRREQLEEMRAIRGALDLEAEENINLRFTDEGVAFTGAPATPRRHWGELANQIPARERAAMKRLEPRAAS